MSKILIAEDEPVSMAIVDNVVKKMGHETVKCLNGKEALDTLMKDSEIKVLITDMKMPVMDGRELYNTVLNIPKLEKLSVIFISAYVSINEIHDLLKNNGTYFVPKPIDVKEFKVYLKSCLKN